MSTDPTAPATCRRRLGLVAGAAAALLVVGGGYVVLSGGGGEAPAAVPQSHARRTPPPAAPVPSAAPAAPADAPLTGRNPYRPVYQASAAPPAAGGGTAGTGAAAASAPTPAAAAPAPAAAPTPAPPAAPPAAPLATVPPTGAAPVTTYLLTLVKVAGPDRTGAYAVTWTVAGVSTPTLVGQRFGRTGELITLAVHLAAGGRRDAVLQVGAMRPVIVRVGQTVSVP